MTRKYINLNNYVCNANNWYTSIQSIWDDMKDGNPRLRRWLNPPPIEPLAYFFRFDANRKGWSWDRKLESCYGFLITYYADPNLIIMTGSEPGGTTEMIKDQSAQTETAGMLPVDWNIPILAELDNSLTQFLESIGLSVPTWIVYVALGTVVYIKIK